ncbi:tol-pal system YbgF family protein [Nocardia sp. NPDC060256]|uniref:tol-pal system YbgF family protein n=1 Tax=unclassified Nocardia TaxID=2637762 RepID=UPI00364CC528
MARSDLRLLFRSTREGLAAQEVFTNRHDEWDSTVRSLRAHKSSVGAPGFSVVDFGRPRRNVLVFYGVGGIGKTALSRQLEECLSGGNTDDSVCWSQLPENIGRLMPVRIDLAPQAGIDFEAAMLAIRLAVGRLGERMPAFDLALRHYWDVNHPQEPLEGYLQRHGFLRRAGSVASLTDHMRSVMEDVADKLSLPTVAGSVATTVVRGLVDALRKKREAVRTLARCTRLADLLEADQDVETLSYFAHLLAWDLAQLPAKKSGTPVVLLDTFEELGDRVHRDLERLFQRVIWLMPNVLFIITGRNRLEWDDPALDGQLDHAGPLKWPGLAPGCASEPCQHLVGYLSNDDRELYLRSRLTHDGEPVIPTAVRAKIATRSHGLPLHLDLSVMQFLDAMEASGAIPGPEAFDRDFPALVARIVRDLTASERTVLRTVSLLDSFSIDLATAAAGLDRDAAALNLVERPFVTNDPDAPWPYRLHDLVRQTVRDADETTDDRWSPADWHRAAQRTFETLGAQLPAVVQAQDRRRLLSCLTQGLRIADDYELPLGWLISAAWRYVDKKIWEPIEIPAFSSAEAPTTPAAALARAAHTISRRQRVHRSETIEELTAILDTGLLPDEAADMARYYLAECQRHLGQYESSAANLHRVAAGTSPRAHDAARGLAHIARHFGDFPTALEALGSLDHNSGYHRALGHIWWLHGDIARACESYSTGRDLAREDHNPGDAALCQAGLALAASFQDRGRADGQIDLACDLLRRVRLNWGDMHVQIACLLRDAGAEPDLPEQAAELEARAAESGLGSSVAYIRLAVCFHHALRSEEAELQTARDRLRQHASNGAYNYLVEITHFFDDTEPPPDLPRAHWIDTTQPAIRWARLINDRRSALGLDCPA